jgi:UDP-2,3-diacylglucosamine hydrolase
MAVYFASDQHLRALDDPNVERFLSFLDEVEAYGDALYLLGDVFEAYLGDDDDDPLLSLLAQRLARLSQRCALFLAHGNRDFLIGTGFAARSGAQLLGDETVCELGDRRALLMHGDSLCVDDAAYQALRGQLRASTWQAQFLAQPLAARRAFASSAREQSKAHTAMSPAEIMDVNDGAVAAAMARHSADILIHGHTHRPAVHRSAAGSRVVLPDWDGQRAWLKWQGGSGVLEARGACIGVPG